MERSRISVIITRAQPGADETAQRVRELGERAILSPVLSIQSETSVTLPDLTSIAGLIFTSANGVRAFADRTTDRSHTAWCVGPATAAAAREVGFHDIYESAGNALDLAHFIAANTFPDGAPLLHVANAAAKGDLKATLETLGFSVLFAPLYAMAPAASLSDNAYGVLASDEPGILLIHSAKGAMSCETLIRAYDAANIILVGISEAAIAPLASKAFREIHVASAPNEDGLFAALATAIATLSA